VSAYEVALAGLGVVMAYMVVLWVVSLFLLQGLILWIVSAPLLAAIHSAEPDSLIATDFFGLAIWCVGFFFEAIGDWQLARFRTDPVNEGKVMDRGLWRYTRHPNYFGDAVLWWGFFVIAAGTTDGWITIFSPAIMTFLLLRVSSVALLERGLKRSRPDYQSYIERTSAFIPLPPKRKNGV